jgi:ankyrin repeat protein
MYNDQTPIDTKFQLLLEALNKKDLKTIKLALEAEFNQSYANQLLIEAINKKYYKAVELILKFGADPNASIQPYLSTALNYAIRPRSIKIAKLLINYGADIHKSYHPLGDPMQSPKMLKFYLSLGADITLRFAQRDELDYMVNDFPLCVAVSHDKITSLKILIKHLENKSPEEREITLSQALLMAIYEVNWKAFEYLIKAGANPNFSDIRGSALRWVFLDIYNYGFNNNNLKLVESLIASGAKFTKDEQRFGKIKTAKYTKYTQHIRKTMLSTIDEYSKSYHESHWIIEEFEDSDLIEENFW